MYKDKIIFFDALGFGWVVDEALLNEISPNQFREDLISDDALVKIIQKNKRVIW